MSIPEVKERQDGYEDIYQLIEKGIRYTASLKNWSVK